jgi:hypothetical protein
MTAGDPLFCGHCGRTYDLKLCPRLHPNPRHAEVCSQCGSREFSTPHPKVSLWWRLLEWLARALFGFFLVILSCLAAVAVLEGVLTSPQLQGGLVGIAILLGVLWWLWSELPEWFRKVVHRSLRRKRSKNEHS